MRSRGRGPSKTLGYLLAVPVTGKMSLKPPRPAKLVLALYRNRRLLSGGEGRK